MKNDGGPAFPCERDRGEKFDSAEGMTLRDYFAAKAMQGMLSNGFIPSTILSNPANLDYALLSYRMADAMLKAREGKV